MPRDGSGVYSLPPGSTYAPNTTIESAKENGVNADLATDANTARPITAGGTGRTTARLLDGTWRFENTADPTKLLALDLSGQTTALTRTQKTPNYNGTLASQALGSAIASASSIDLGAASGSTVHITGTTTITALGTADAGIAKAVVFDGILTLTHNATSLILPGAANITTAARDTAVFVSEGSGNWRCLDYCVNVAAIYKEGIWTPTIAFGGAAVGVTYNAVTKGTYTKIGRLVTLTGLVSLTSKGSSTGSITIPGLPFPVNATFEASGAVGFYSNWTGLTGVLQITAAPGTSTLTLYQQSGGTSISATNTVATNTSGVFFTVTYEV